MHRSNRITLLAALLVGALLVSSDPAQSAEPAWTAVLACERKVSRGRVVCEIEIEANGGRLPWADVVVVSTPDFVRPLKSRVGPLDARAKSDSRIRLPIGFIAERLGEGRVVVRARAAVCSANASGERCRSVTREAATVLAVGPIR